MNGTATPNLAELPSMDELAIGPGGQTFGQLKAAVVTSRAAYMSHECQVCLDALLDAQGMLRAAYTRVGLPYVAP